MIWIEWILLNRYTIVTQTNQTAFERNGLGKNSPILCKFPTL